MPNVNGVRNLGSATGVAPQVGAVGSDTNIDLALAAQGTGIIRLLAALAGGGTYGLTLGSAAITIGSDADVTLSAAQALQPLIKIPSGTWTTGRNIIVPIANCQTDQIYIVYNGNGQTATFKASTGTGVAIATTKTALVRFDGTNFVRVTADA